MLCFNMDFLVALTYETLFQLLLLFMDTFGTKKIHHVVVANMIIGFVDYSID